MIILTIQFPRLKYNTFTLRAPAPPLFSSLITFSAFDPRSRKVLEMSGDFQLRIERNLRTKQELSSSSSSSFPRELPLGSLDTAEHGIWKGRPRPPIPRGIGRARPSFLLLLRRWSSKFRDPGRGEGVRSRKKRPGSGRSSRRGRDRGFDENRERTRPWSAKERRGRAHPLFSFPG